MSIQELTNANKKKSTFAGKFSSLYERLTGSGRELIGNIKGDVVIRRLNPDEEDDAKNMIRNTLLEFGGISIDSMYFDSDLEYLLETYSHHGAGLFVAVKNKEIIGTAGIKHLTDEQGHVVDGAGELKHFFIKSDYRGQGIGNRFMRRMIEEARGMGYTRCHASVSSVFRHLPDMLTKGGFKLASATHKTDNYDKEYVIDL